jgi:hypothetical protein
MIPVIVLIFLAIVSGLAFYMMNTPEDDATTTTTMNTADDADTDTDTTAADDGAEARRFGSPPGLLALERPKNRFGGSREHRGMNPGAVQSLMRPTKFGSRRDVSAQLGDIHGMPNSLVNLGFPKVEKRNMIGPMSSTPY